MIGILNQKWVKMKLAFLWLYNSFVFRLIWAILTFVVILLVLVFVIRILDKFDIVQRSLLYFKPYASSLPWILTIGFCSLLLCIPGISVELKNLLNRLESVCGKLHFYQKQDQDLSNEANNEVNEDCADCISGLEEDGNIQAQLKPTASGGKSQGLRAVPQRDALSSDKLKALIARKIQEIRRRKNLIVQLHGGQTRSVLVDQNIGIRGFELQFDARYEIGRMTILAKVFSLPSSVVDSFCMDFDSLRERFRSEKVVLHLLLYFRKQISPDLRKEWVARIQLMTSQYESIQIYFYSVSEDNSVKPLG